MNPYPITQSIIHLPAALPLSLTPIPTCLHWSPAPRPGMSERERRGRWKDTLSRSSSPSWRRTGFHVGWVGWLVTPNHPDDASTDGRRGRRRREGRSLLRRTSHEWVRPSIHSSPSRASDRVVVVVYSIKHRSTRWTWQPPRPEMLRGTILWR